MARYFPVVMVASTLVASACSRTCSDDASRRSASTGEAPEPSRTLDRNMSDTGAGSRHLPNRYIAVDQFGYLPSSSKIAVLVDPVLGWNEKDSYAPARSLQVRRWSDDAIVFEGPSTPWNAGQVDPNAGDRGAWFDFSAVNTPGSYFIYDPDRYARSHRFEIETDVYRAVLRAALKAFYFNRANVPKKAPHACVGDKCWELGPDNIGPSQDREARSVHARRDPETARDLSGGWWDAGDTNKYVTFAHAPVHQLLSAYQEHPQAFRDDVGIPESGNGLPDLLDELKVELDWLKRMQADDLGGGALLKMGNVDHNVPIPDQSTGPRYYYPGACSSSTIAVSGMFAQASLVLRKWAQLEAYADDLLARARKAWDHYHSQPRSDACDDGSITGGDADRELRVQDQMAVVAAVYLLAATAETAYGDYVAGSYRKTRPFLEDRWSVYDPAQGDALLYYTTLKTANSEVTKAILERKRHQAETEDVYGFRPELSLYRAYMRPDSFHWGSNMARANYANTNYDLLEFEIASRLQESEIRERVEGILHWFHGVNALQLVYLSNMGAFGAEHGVTEIFHFWFRDGDPRWDSAKTSKLGPAPGYLAGGPNRRYCKGQDPKRTACARSRLLRQPPEKAYLDFNTGHRPEIEHDRSWELSEPGIYYQAAYVKLLSKFVD